MSIGLSLESIRRAAAVPTTAPVRAMPSQHFKALDGVRGIAILVVVILHLSGLMKSTGREGLIREVFIPGYLGVTLFFVLSGFLITRILVRARGGRNYFSNFYLRRSLRIFPLYFGYLALMLFAYYPYSHWQAGDRYEFDSHFLSYLFYTNNIHWYRYSDAGLMHLWSLAIEEQFYLIWPFVIFLMPHRWLLGTCALGCLASLACRIIMNIQGFNVGIIYSATPCRMDSLLMGAAVGLIELDGGARQRLVRALGPLTLVCLGGILYLTAAHGIVSSTPEVFTWGWTIISLFFALVVFWAATSGAESRMLNWSWLRFLGKYSYGIYVLHFLPMIIAANQFDQSLRSGRIGTIAVSIVGTAVLTALSWHFVESPFLRQKSQLTSTA